MATRTWTAAVNTDYTNVGNWAEGAAAADGDTVDCSTSTMPATNRPTTGTLHFNLTYDLPTIVVVSFFDGPICGNVTINTTTKINAIDVGVPHASLTVTSGYALITSSCTNTGAVTVSGTADVAKLAVAVVQTYTVYDTAMTLNGDMELFAGAVLDANGVIDGASPTITLEDGAGIMGGVNVTGATWTIGTGCVLTCDVAGTLNLGGKATGLAISNAGLVGTVTMGAALVCGDISLTAGTLNTAGYPVSCTNLAGPGGILNIATGSSIRCPGTFDGTGNTITTSGGRIDCVGTGRATAIDCSSTGRLIVYRAKDASKRIVGWNQDGCTNVRHYPARIIGQQQGLQIP